MKIVSIIQRGNKRDFVDIFFLIKKFSLKNIFKFVTKKYPEFNIYLALQALTYFDDAESERESEKRIKLLKKFDWEKAKEFIIDYKKRFKKYLWFMEDIDFEKDKEVIITQVLNYGTWEDIKLLFKLYGEEEIKKIIANPRRGTFFKKVLNFWKIIFNIDIPEEKFKRAIINLTPEFE